MHSETHTDASEPARPNRRSRRLLKGAKGASAYFNGDVSVREIYTHVEAGRIPVIRMGSTLYFDADDLDAAFRTETSA